MFFWNMTNVLLYNCSSYTDQQNLFLPLKVVVWLN